MQPRHYSQLYRELRSVDPDDFQRVIRMYEERETEIGRLDVLENYELTTYYVDALFETGAYRKHQLMVDLVIHASIEHDIRRVPGREEDVYEFQLFRKAASAFRIQEYGTTEHILRELIRMNPRRALYFHFLRTTIFRSRQGILQVGRAICILCMLLTALVVTINLLFIRSFYPEYAKLATALSIGFFAGGVLVLLLLYGYAFYLAHRSAGQFRAEQANKRRS